jgi:hypothetical protein
MPELAFILVNEPVYPDGEAVLAAATHTGFELSLAPRDEDEPLVFEIEGGAKLMVMLIDAPHPDVAQMATGPLSPDPEPLAAAKAHYIVTALGIEGSNAEKDMYMAALTGAVAASSDAVGVMLGHGALFHRPELFAGLGHEAIREGVLPIEVCIDVTAAPESEERMSFLSYGMPRYGREDFYVTARIEGEGALEFLYSMVRWMITDPDKELPTGDTMGRTPEEKFVVQRVPNPTGEGDEVIRLDLP